MGRNSKNLGRITKNKNLPNALTGVIEINYKDFKLLRDKFDLKKI